MTRDYIQHRFANLTADPSVLADGDMWYRSDTDTLKLRNGGATQNIGSTPWGSLISNVWYPVSAAGGSSNALTANRIYAWPVVFGRGGTLSGVAVNCTATGSGGTRSFRTGLFADNGTGQPGSLIADFGSVSASVAVLTWSPSQAIKPWTPYHLAVMYHSSGTTTEASGTTAASHFNRDLSKSGTSTPISGTFTNTGSCNFFQSASVPAVGSPLPSTFTLDPASYSSGIQMYFKVT